MKFAVYFTGSIIATISVLVYAVVTHEQFYPIILFLLTSKVSMVVNANMCFAAAMASAKIGTFLFLGQLRDVETELLMERSKYSITETCLALTIFRNELTPGVAAISGALLFLRAFHWLSGSRIDFLDQVMPLSHWTHIRLISLILFLTVADVVATYWCVEYTITNGKSVLFLFGFEFGLLCLSATNLIFRFLFHVLDIRLPNGLASKGLYIMILDLICDAVRFVTYVFFFCLVFLYYGLPIHLIRELWLAFYNFQRRLTSFIKYSKLSRNLSDRFETATAEELTAAGDCLICREPMDAGKKLPCSHVFHLDCLRMWLQHQQSCPLCRCDIPLTTPAAPTPAAMAAAAVAADLRAAEGVQRAANGAAGDGPAAVSDSPRNIPPTPLVPGLSSRRQRQELVAYHQQRARQLQENALLGSSGSGLHKRPRTRQATSSLTAKQIREESSTTIPKLEKSVEDEGERATTLQQSEEGLSGTNESALEDTKGQGEEPSPEKIDETEEATTGFEERSRNLDSQFSRDLDAAISQLAPTKSRRKTRTFVPHASSFPCFYAVLVLGPSSTAAAQVRSAPRRNSDIVRNLSQGAAVLILSSEYDENSNHWLQLRDGWVLEREDFTGRENQQRTTVLLISLQRCISKSGLSFHEALLEDRERKLSSLLTDLLPTAAKSDYEPDLPAKVMDDDCGLQSEATEEQYEWIQQQLTLLSSQIAEMKQQGDRLETALQAIQHELSANAEKKNE